MGVPTAFLPRGSAPSRGPFLCLGILATRKRVNKFFEAHLICYLVFLQLVFDIFLNALFVFVYRIYKLSSCPKMSVTKSLINLSQLGSSKPIIT